MTIKTNNRPLSPHLQIYKPQITSVLSILHRLTGVALIFGTFLVIATLLAAATGEEAYNKVMGLMSSTIGQLMILGWSFALIYHMMNGVRHLIWDTGRLFNIKHAAIAGHIVFWGAVAITAALWGYASTNAPDNVVTQYEITTDDAAAAAVTETNATP